MIRKYLDSGEMYVLMTNGRAVAIAVVGMAGEGECELFNLATAPDQRRKGYATHLVRHLLKLYQPRCERMLVGTSPAMVPFYKRFGFEECGARKCFFSENYSEPIIENGQTLTDMILLSRKL